MMFTSLTDNKPTVTACYEHGGSLFFGSLGLFGTQGLLRGGSEGDGQVAGVLRGPSWTGQGADCGGGDGGFVTIGDTAADPDLLRRKSPGHDVDHSLLVALHAGAKLKELDLLFNAHWNFIQSPQTHKMCNTLHKCTSQCLDEH